MPVSNSDVGGHARPRAAPAGIFPQGSGGIDGAHLPRLLAHPGGQLAKVIKLL